MRALGVVLLLSLAVGGCAGPVTPSGGAAASGSTAGVIKVVTGFDLYTHCGVRETKIGSDYYQASPVLDDGNGNPPAGWDNPYQQGTMTVLSDGTARFSDSAGHSVVFVKRPGATGFLRICS